MSNRTIIPFGPQHPVLPEPIHLDLVIEDEKVIEAIPSIGFIHRGLEKLVEKKDFADFVFVAERICGICSFIHGMTYCQAIEEIMQIQVPARALYLRTIWGEMSRLHSHLLWMGLLADAFGFESLFMHSWRIREKILDIIEETTGGRVIFGSAKVGGVRKDIDNDTLKRIMATLLDIEKEIKEIADTFLNDKSVKHRTTGVGVLSKADAYALGAVGPMARASGVAQDMRLLGYAAFKDIKIQPIIDTAGDSYARTKVRIGELFQSVDIIRRCVEKMPDGPVEVKVTAPRPSPTFRR
jgi:ech hydrogenase subunit E